MLWDMFFENALLLPYFEALKFNSNKCQHLKLHWKQQGLSNPNGRFFCL